MMKNKKYKNIQGQISLDYSGLQTVLKGQGLLYKLARVLIAITDRLVHENIILKLKWTTNDRIKLQKLQQDYRNLCLQVAHVFIEMDVCDMTELEMSIMKDITDKYPISVSKLRKELL